jgi:aquaporin Z
MRVVDTKKLLAELVGTFTFFTIGFMAIQSTKAFVSGPDLVVIAFGFGFGLFAAIQIFGGVSGGHFNPAVTVAAVLDKRLDPMTGVGYVVSQLIGGIAAAAVILVLFDQAAVAGTVTQPGNGIDTIILVSTKKAPTQAAFAIPLTLMVIHFAIVPFTGSSVNPARSIASAVVGGNLNDLWIYIVGPIVGGIIGWGVYRVATGEVDAA